MSDNTIFFGTCKCGEYGQVLNEQAERETGKCHLPAPVDDGGELVERANKLADKLETVWNEYCGEDAGSDTLTPHKSGLGSQFHADLEDGWDLYNAVELLRALSPPPVDAGRIESLFREIMRMHSDPDCPEYNECDKPGEKCKWCGDAEKVLSALTAQPEAGETCEHGNGLTDYCQPCGRINGGG